MRRESTLIKGNSAVPMTHGPRHTTTNVSNDFYRIQRSKRDVHAAMPAPVVNGIDGFVKCPELLITGLEFEQKGVLQTLYKKGKRFESGWNAYFVGIYAHMLFYYEKLEDLPRGVVPLIGCTVKAVDRIFKNSDSNTNAEPIAEDCGPCWKVTSSAGRVLLFRSQSKESRNEWIERIVAVNQKGTERSHRGSDDTSSRAAIHLRQSFDDQYVSKKQVDPEVSKMLRDAMLLVKKQKQEIIELKLQLKALQDAASVEVNSNSSTTVASTLPPVVEKSSTQVTLPQSPIITPRDELVRVSPPEMSVDDQELTTDINSISPSEEMTEQLQVQYSDLPEESSDDSSLTTPESAKPSPAEESNCANAIANDNEDARTSLSATRTSLDVTESDALQQQANELAEIARSLQASTTPPSSDANKAEVDIPSSSRVSDDDSANSSTLQRTNISDNELLQQQANEIAEIARSLQTTSAPPSLVTKDKPATIAPTPTSADDTMSNTTFKQSNLDVSGNDLLQQQAIELAEIARNLQSSFRSDLVPATSMNGSSSTTSTFLGQINSSENDSLLTFTADEDLFVGTEEEIERLSEFDASESRFLEASGILDSIHHVMKDLIVTTQPVTQPDSAIITDEMIAEIREGIGADKRKEAEESETFYLRSLRSRSEGEESRILNSPDTLLARARSERAFRRELPAPTDLSAFVVEESMVILASILQTACREDKMTLLNPLLRIFGSHNRLSRLIRWAIEIEVASVINVATLFRSDDYASRLVSTYSKAVGLEFIRDVLSKPIRKVFKLKIADLELSPDKDETLRNESHAVANADNLMKACQNILDSILNNADQIPSSYFHICSDLNSKVISRFDGTREGVAVEDPESLTRSVIGGFLFLRFVCPAITTPHLYGLTDKEAPPGTRRVLVLLTKLLFKTATCVLFGDREPQFKVLNPFILRNSPAIQRLFVKLSMQPADNIDECFAMDSRHIYSDVPPSQLASDITVIRTVVEKNLETVEKKLIAYGCSPQRIEDFKIALVESKEVDSFMAQKHSKGKKLTVNMKFLSSFGKKTRKQAEV